MRLLLFNWGGCMGCDRDCFHCKYKDCILPYDDISEQEIIDSENRDAKFFELNANAHQKYYLTNKEKIQQRTKDWYKLHQKEMSEYNKTYYQKNKDKIKKYKKQWYKDNKKRITEKHKNYRIANRDKLREKQKAWAEANIDKIKGYYIKHYYLKQKAQRQINKEKS